MPGFDPSVECILCRRSFTEVDILGYRYFIESGICEQCYKKMQALPASISCFGKNGKHGYDPISRECKQLCPDRKVCPMFLGSRLQRLKRETTEAIVSGLDQVHVRTNELQKQNPFRRGSATYEAFNLCKKGVAANQFIQFTRRKGVDKGRLLRMFRKEELYGQQWEWDESEEIYSITVRDQKQCV